MNEQQVCVVGRRRSRAEVEQLVAEFESSGLSRIEFCRERGLAFEHSWPVPEARGAAKASSQQCLACRGAIQSAAGIPRGGGQRVGGGAAERAADRSGVWIRRERAGAVGTRVGGGLNMFGWGGATRIYLAAGATDMRKGFEGLY